MANARRGAFPAMGRIFVTGKTGPGRLYRIEPVPVRRAPSPRSRRNLGSNLAQAIAFDGGRLWTSNIGGSISIVTPGAAMPWTVTTVTAGFAAPPGIGYDGSNIWVDRLNAGDAPEARCERGGPAAGDGRRRWAPAGLRRRPTSGSQQRVGLRRRRAGLHRSAPRDADRQRPRATRAAAFDGQRVLIPNDTTAGVWIWKAADLSPIWASFRSGVGACHPRLPATG